MAYGNLYTFLNRVHESYFGMTDTPLYERLSAMRGNLPCAAFRRASLAYNHDLHCWLVPVFNERGRITNLLKWYPDSQKLGYGKPKLLATPDCKRSLFGLESLEHSGAIYICEGEWDAITLRWLLAAASVVRAAVPNPYSVLAVPGSGVFKREWAEMFRDREVILIYDHDAAGRKGLEKAIKVIGNHTSKISHVRWTNDLPDKYDLRDFICDNLKEGKKASATYISLSGLITSITEADHQPETSDGVPDIVITPKHVERIPVNNFLEVIDSFKSCLHVDLNFIDALTIATGIAISVRIPGDPIWGFMVGPPSSGKTTLVETFLGSDEYAEGVSKLTATALISGYKSAKGDCSFLKRLHKKLLVIKDFTAVKRMPAALQAELFGLLRDIHDGHCKIPYGNNLIRDYSDIRFSILAAVTDIIHGDNHSTLGDKFIKVELLGDDYDSNSQVLAAIEGTAHKMERMKFLQGVILSFLDKNKTIDWEPSIPDTYKHRLVGLSQVAGALRAQVERENRGNLRYRPRQESGGRLGAILSRLGKSCCIVLDKAEVDDDVYYLMEKVALDTTTGFNLEIVSALARLESGYTQVDELKTKLQLSRSTIERHLNDMQELGILKARKRPATRRGHPIYDWQLTSSFQEKWDMAGLFRKSLRR